MFPKRFASLVPFFVVVVMVALSFIPLGVVRAITCDVPTTTYPTIQSAVDDSSCDTINLTNPSGSPYFEHITINARTMTIQGQGAANTAVDGSDSGTVFTIQSGAVVTLTNITIQKGSTLSGWGGGINNAGTLMVISSTLRGNYATEGGGIYNYGTATITNTTLISNTADNDAGGIANSGTLTVAESTLSGNYPNGIANSGTLTVAESTLSGNYYGGGITNRGTATVTEGTLSGNYGGGITNSGTATVTESTLSGNNSSGITNWGTLTLTDSILSGNSSYEGGGIYNQGTVTVIGSTLINNTATFGGGIKGGVTVIDSTLSGNTAYLGGGIAGSVTMINSTMSDNSAYGSGGGIYDAPILVNHTLNNNAADSSGGGNTMLVNSTLSNNSAAQDGGGIFIDSYRSAMLVNSTLISNSAAQDGGGIFNNGNNSRVILTSSIVANSLNSDDCGGSTLFFSQGYNIVSDASCILTGPGDLPNTDPLLGPLQDNGGPTLTHAPLTGSPAIDGGDNTACPVTDQRGFTRPLDGDGNGIATCDIGSVENDGTTGEPDPQQAIEALIADVQSLVDAGVLNPYIGNALITRLLEPAIQTLKQGDITRTIRYLQIFIYKIDHLILRGVLTPEHGQPLIQAANEIIEDLNSP